MEWEVRLRRRRADPSVADTSAGDVGSGVLHPTRVGPNAVGCAPGNNDDGDLAALHIVVFFCATPLWIWIDKEKKVEWLGGCEKGDEAGVG
ncbi:hypothetical protein E2562_022539 [Oryza meyeriana var. granulata]|uniref:Uncharacterized protein n=1 Tax=Oryza meyeriana var. granulata TaxID=110450 RepID=A0A6G1FB08_9ORYZ|nr:hypothetical protein E2562_022539 [Oryza meyeriana var. granulata]